MKTNIFINKRVGKAAILACLIVAFMALCLTGCQTDENVHNGEPVTLGPDATQEQLQEKLSDENVSEVILSGNISLTEPLQITGSKTISGSGTISADGLKDTYLIEVPAGAKLTLGGDVVVDAAEIAGGVHTAKDAVLTVQDQAVIKNASAESANVLVEGFLDVLGGTLSGAKGHNVYNVGETNIVGGEVRGSGSGFAGIYNEGTLSQNGGAVIGGYNNIVNAEGSKYTWNDGSNESAVNNGMVVAPNAELTVTAKSATLTGAGNLGIDLQGTAVIDNITLSDCFNTMIKVASTGKLTLNGGMIFNGSYHGVDNDGVMVMNGGDIMNCADTGIVNTGTLEVKGGGISNNGNKGIDNKLEGKATVVSDDVMISGNRFAIGNEDNAYFELAKASLMMSTTSNIYALDGEMYIHDIVLGASSSNNIRVVAADLTLEDVTVNGNASGGSQSMHGIILEGGTVTATNLTVQRTTGAGIRNKGGVFTGKNVTLTNNAYIGIYTSDQDVTGRPGTTTITNLTVSEQGYMSISSNGTGVMEITNGVFEATPSNNIRVNGGTLKLNKVEVKGHTAQATTAHHGVYLEGGHIIANDLTISNTKGHGLRNKSGDFTGTNVTIKNVNGDAAVSNVVLADGTSGTITLNNVSFSNVKSKNVVCEAGTIIINGSYLSPAPGSNIKITGGAVSLNNVTVAGNQKVGTAALHAIILENGYGALYMNDVTICDAKDSGIRNKTGVVKGEDVTIKDCGASAISNGQDTTRGLKGITTIEGLTVEDCGNNNIVVDAGEVHVSDANLAITKSNNVKTSGTGVLTLTNTVVDGSTDSYGVISEGGTIELTDVTIKNTKTAGIRVNKTTSLVTGKNVTIENTGTHGLYVDNGAVIIDGLTTKNIGQRNIQVGTNANAAEGIAANGGTVKITNGDLCLTENQHSVVAYGENAGTMLELINVVLQGSGSGGGDRHVILAEGGNAKLIDVTIKNAKSAALRVNKAGSVVEAENLTIEGGYNGITASAGTVNVKNLNATATNRNVSAEGATITIDGATLGTTSTHNIKINKGTLILKNATMLGSSGRGIMVEPGASDGQPKLNLENVTISNTTSRALENRGGIVVAKGLTITDSKDYAIQNQLHVDGKTAGSITVENYTASNVTRSINNDAGTVTVVGGDLGSTNGHNVKAAAGTVSLIDVTINGTTSNSGVMAEGGSFTLKNVTIKNTKASGVRINKAASSVTATNLTVQGAQDGGIFASAGTVTVDTYIASGNNRNIDVSGANVSVTNASLGATTTHNVKTSAGTLVLNNATIEGSSTYGIICEGGTVNAQDLNVKNTKDSALRVNNANGSMTVINLTVENCANSIKSNAGSMLVDTVTANTTGVNVMSQGASITLNNATLTNSGNANVVEHTGGSLNLTNVEVGAAGEGFYQIYNTAENLNLAGKIVGNIMNDKAVTVNVMAALSADTAIVIDWTEGNAPSGTAIAFVEGTVEAGQNCFTLGDIQSQLKKLVFVGNTGVLENLTNYVVQIGENKYESLEEAVAELNKLTGNVTMTVLADCGSEDPIVIPAGINLTIQGDKNLVGLDATVRVSAGANLTIGENVNISKVEAVVNGEPYETVLTLPEGSSATADMFDLIDASGNVYGAMIENGKVMVYTKEVTDEASMLAAVNGAPDNKRGYIIVADDVTLSTTLTFPASKILTVMDDGKEVRTISRTSATVDMINIVSGANITIKSSDDSSVKLVLDGNSVGNNGLAMVRVVGGTADIHNVNIVNANKNYNLYCSSGSLTVSSAELGKNYEVSSVYVTGGKVSLTDVIVDDAGSNSIRAQGGEIALHNVTVNSHTRSATIHNIMIDGGAVTSTGTLTLQNSKASGIRISSGSFSGETVNISNTAAYAIWVSAGSARIKTLNVDTTKNYAILNEGGEVTVTTGGSIRNANRNVHVTKGNVSLTGMTLGNTSATHNVKLVDGKLTLTDTVVEGTTTSGYGLIIEQGSGVAELNNVTIRNTASNGIHITSGESKLIGNGITVDNAGGTSLNLTNGATVDISNFTTLNVTQAHSIKATNASKLTINGMNLAQSNSNNINLNDTASLTLKGTCVINGTRTNNGITLNGSSSVHISGEFTTRGCAGNGIYGQGGTVELSGKVNTDVKYTSAVALNVTGALTSGSAVTVDWNEGKAPADTAIAFASADVMAASRDYFTLGPVQTAANKTLKFADAKAVLVDFTVVTTAAELTNALASGGDFTAIKLAGDTEYAVASLNVGAKEVLIQGASGAVIKYSGSTKDANLLNLSSGGKLTLDGVTLDGNKVGKMMIESGETVTMKNCTVQNANGTGNRTVDVNGGNLVIEGNLNLNNLNWALCAQNGGRITSKPGSKVTVTTAAYGVVVHNASRVELEHVVTTGITNHPLYLDNDNAVMVVNKAEISGGSKGANIIKGQLTLNNATIQNISGYGIHLQNTTSKLYGSNIHVENTTTTALHVAKGLVDISNYSTAAVNSGHGMKTENDSNVTINGLNLSQTSSNNISINGTSVVTLKGVCTVNGGVTNNGVTVANGSTLIINGDFTAQNVKNGEFGLESWGGTIRIAGKVNSSINYTETRALEITGALTAGSNISVDWLAGKAPAAGATAIQFANAGVLTASRNYITLGAVQAANYELSYGETTATLIAKASASSVELEVEPTQEQ